MIRSARITLVALSLLVTFSIGCSQNGDDGWTDLFNGEDLTGWQAEGEARWFVEDDCLVGTQGPNNEPGDLFTEETFGDFDLITTYRIVWPANSGIWFRYVDAKTAYQADIRTPQARRLQRNALLPGPHVPRRQPGQVDCQQGRLEHDAHQMRR
jgi:hypothetical protein